MRKSLKFILCLISADIIIIAILLLCNVVGMFSKNSDKPDTQKIVSETTTKNKLTESEPATEELSETQADSAAMSATSSDETENITETTTAATANRFIVLNGTSKVYMRDDPSTNGNILCELPANTYGNVIDTEGRWTKISYKQKTGYVFSEYIITGDSAEDLIETLNSSKVIIDKSCNVRNTPDTNSPVIGNAAAGTIYQYIKSASDEQWYAIIMPDGSIAYIATGYASKTN